MYEEKRDNTFYATPDGNELNGEQIDSVKGKIDAIFDADDLGKDVEEYPEISLGSSSKIF